MRNKLLCIKSAISSCTYTSLKIRKTLISPFYLAGFKVMLSGSKDDLGPKCFWLTGKISKQFRCWHCACHRYRQKQCSWLAPKFIRFDAMGKLWFTSIRNGTEGRNPKKTEKLMTSRFLKWCIQFQCLDGVSEDGVETLLRVCNSPVQKGINLIPWFKWKVG